MWESAAIDALRSAHLLCFAAGMGVSLYTELRLVSLMATLLEERHVDELDRAHRWVTVAFGGLWITGLGLIYARTGFDAAAFPPKLWVKLALMAVMTLNALVIGRLVLQVLDGEVGWPLIAAPLPVLSFLTAVAVVSAFGWTSGMLLGASAVLQVAPLRVVLGVMGALLLAIAAGAVLLMVMLRRRHMPSLVVPKPGPIKRIRRVLLP